MGADSDRQTGADSDRQNSQRDLNSVVDKSQTGADSDRQMGADSDRQKGADSDRQNSQRDLNSVVPSCFALPLFLSRIAQLGGTVTSDVALIVIIGPPHSPCFLINVFQNYVVTSLQFIQRPSHGLQREIFVARLDRTSKMQTWVKVNT